jgi:hypothetical protein
LETECRIAIALVMPPPWQNLTHKANQQNSKLDPGINAGENTEMRKTKPNLTRARKIRQCGPKWAAAAFLANVSLCAQ